MILSLKYKTLRKHKYLALTWLFTFLFIASNLFAQTTDDFSSSGTWIAPAGVTSVTVECWGAGGAGGGNTTGADGAGGAGGGAYSMTIGIPVIPGNSYTVTVGTGGVAVSGSAGGTGGDSWFIDIATILAKGGTGGIDPIGGAAGIAGTGGAAGSGIGTTRYSGGNGGNGADNNNGAGGGGGSSAGTAANGNDGGAAVDESPGLGGIAPLDGGAGGDGGAIDNAGNAGLTPGGAGGGAGDNGGAGGNGSDGHISITYTVLSADCPVSTSVSPGTIQTLCQGDASSQLTATVTTSGGDGTPTLLYQWYYNTTNSNTVSGATLIAGATNQNYTPLTSAAELGERWYFCVGYATDNTCAQTDATQSLASNTVQLTVITTPDTPGLIFGNTTVPEETTGLSYAIIAVNYATSYTWSVPTGWTITSGQGTTGIIVTSGTAGQNGDITVTAGNTCGTSTAAILAVVSETPIDHILYGCNACHITHSAPGNTLTSTLGNANLCMSCHVSSGSASGKPFTNADKAIPGVSGNSHAWDVASVNASYETVLTTDPEMVLRIDGGNITCSVCHDQHNSNANLNYIRVSNAGDYMCKNCHLPRNVGRYVDNTSLNKGSHPVGLTYTGTGDYEATPTGSAILVGGNIECSSCHQTHYAPTSDGTLLRQANDNALCTSCHTMGTHNGMSCNDCHQSHNTNKANIYMIRNTITTPNSGDRTVNFSALTGTNSFADGDATYDGICEVCHTTTLHYQNDGTSGDQNHTSSGGPMDGQDCSTCHPHNSNFTPIGCDECHDTDAPTFGSAVHIKHKDTYGYSCSTCHFNYGSGGSLEGGTHPSGSIDINFDPNGMATRNGQDAITPVFNGDKTCDNTYCHSDGRSAYRGTDGTYTWGSTDPEIGTYATTPVWGSGTIIDCMPCHSGTGNMNDPYTITSPGLNPVLPPETGAHRRGAHLSNSQENDENGWDVVNCFWCHNTNDGDDGSPINQGTYGTGFHVDGAILFDPRSFVDGGTIIDNPTGGSFSYSLLGSSGHCGDGKTCW